MGAIGTGNITQGLVTLSLGTSGTVCAYSPNSVVCDSAMVANFCASHGGWLPLICTMNVTSATTRVRELFGLDLATFGEQVASARETSRPSRRRDPVVLRVADDKQLELFVVTLWQLPPLGDHPTSRPKLASDLPRGVQHGFPRGGFEVLAREPPELGCVGGEDVDL